MLPGMLIGLGVMASGLMLGAGSASAQGVVDAPRIAAAFGAGFGGELNTTLGSFSTIAEPEPSFGGNLRYEAPIFEFLSLGGMVEGLSIQANTRGSERRWLFNLDLWLKLRVPVDLDSIAMEFYIGVPGGLTVAAFDDPNAPSDQTAWPGWNAGGMAGVQFFFTEHLGVMAEAGWRAYQVFNKLDFGDVEVNVLLHQFHANGGVVIMF